MAFDPLHANKPMSSMGLLKKLCISIIACTPTVCTVKQFGDHLAIMNGGDHKITEPNDHHHATDRTLLSEKWSEEQENEGIALEKYYLNPWMLFKSIRLEEYKHSSQFAPWNEKLEVKYASNARDLYHCADMMVQHGFCVMDPQVAFGHLKTKQFNGGFAWPTKGKEYPMNMGKWYLNTESSERLKWVEQTENMIRHVIPYVTGWKNSTWRTSTIIHQGTRKDKTMNYLHTDAEGGGELNVWFPHLSRKRLVVVSTQTEEGQNIQSAKNKAVVIEKHGKVTRPGCMVFFWSYPANKSIHRVPHGGVFIGHEDEEEVVYMPDMYASSHFMVWPGSWK